MPIIDRQQLNGGHRYGRGAIVLVALSVFVASCGQESAEPHVKESPAGEQVPTPFDEPDDAPDLAVKLTLTEVGRLGAAIAADVGPNGQLFVADRSGTIHPLTDGGIGSAVIDISAEVTTAAERGLLGIAFAADMSELYVSFTDQAGDTAVDAFALENGKIAADQRRRVFSLEQPYANHNGGDIQIGPDGMLFLGLGDGGGSGDPLAAGQDRQTLLGALLRLDAQGGDPYAIPSDNPFVGVDAVRDEIFAYGLRNPWRFSFDTKTGHLWIADVGQNAREELNRLQLPDDAGANLGWNLMEGMLEFAGREPDAHHRPIYEYETSTSRCAVTGGYVYRGKRIPELAGAYLFSDYCEGQIRAIWMANGAVGDSADLGINGGQVVSFAQDDDGELYVLSLGGGIYRIDPAD